MTDVSSQRKRLLIASESTYNTDAIATILTTNTADIIYQDCTEPKIDPDRDIVHLARARGSHSGTKHTTLPKKSGFSAKFPMTGWISGAAGEEMPYYAAILKAAGFDETISSGASATYKPATKQQEGMSAYLLHRHVDDANWRLDYATGIRHNLTFEFENQKEAMISVEGDGTYGQELSDGAAYVNSSGEIALLKDGSTAVTARSTGEEKYANSADVMMVRGMTFQVNSNTWDVSKVTLGTNWTITIKEVATATGSVQKVYLTRGDDDQRMGGSATLVDGGTALNDMLDQYEAGGELSLNLVLTAGDGSSGSSRITITASKLQIGKPSRGDVNGLLSHDIPFMLNGDWSNLAADNDVTIVYDQVP